jgi:D-apiose dehydrogenase
VSQHHDLRVAVIGTGYFSQFHLQGWEQVVGARVVALCDRDTALATTAAKQFNVDAVVTDVNALAARSDIDLFDVIVPPTAQSQVLNALLPIGKPVICQKPFGQNYAQAVAFTNAAKQHHAPLIVHENFRFMPWFREAKRLVDSGALGALHNVSFRLRPGDGQGPNAYLDRQPYFQKMPRLLVVETAIHLIDAFRMICGEISTVYAHLRRLNPVIAGEDAGIIVFEFANGAAGIFDGNRLNDHVAANPRTTMGEMWLEGSAGVLRLDGDARLWFKPHHQAEHEHNYAHQTDLGFGGGACGALQQHFIDALHQQRPPENTAREYLTNLRIQEAVYRSNSTHQRITLANFDPLDVAVTPNTHQ